VNILKLPLKCKKNTILEATRSYRNTLWVCFFGTLTLIRGWWILYAITNSG